MGFLGTFRRRGFPQREIRMADSPSIDAFARVRGSSPETLFESVFEYNAQPLLWRQDVAGAGAITHIPDESALSLSVGTASGDRATSQTASYHRYQPGKSLLFTGTGILGASKTNVVCCIGYFDDNNGVFFEVNELGLHVVIRSNVSGAPVDTKVLQSAWNMDKLNGSGPSKITFDPTKIQIFLADFQWLGAGRVRIGFSISGVTIYVHEFNHSNLTEEVFMRTANLPIRYEIENTGVAASGTSMKQVCSTVISEGDFQPTAPTMSADTGITHPSISARNTILILRPKLLFNSLENRATIIPVSHEIFASLNNIVWELIKGGTFGIGPTWVDVGAGSPAEYSLTNTTLTGGVKIGSGFATTGAGANPGISVSDDVDILSKFSQALAVSFNEQETVSLVATPFSGSANVSAKISWKEFF